ncbi:Ion channel regulatory protein UNC-93, partial [Geosmithia morbida]
VATTRAVTRDSDTGEFVDRPAGWIYKGFRVFGHELWYASPTIQLLMVSIVCFLCPGMFNALSGLGGGGQVDTDAQTYANTALYGVFAVVGFFSGTIANVIGLRLTLAMGGIGYALYASSFLAYSHIQSLPFVVFAGAFLGISAGLLWTAQGAIMMAYPTENLKGRYISWFWIIFNTGAVIGSLIPLAQNVNKTSGPVSDGTYAAFIVLMVLGLVLGLFIVNADKVIREDGTKVILMKNASWRTEFFGLWETLWNDPWITLLFPMFFASNIFYTYQNNGLNATHFNIRSRSLNGLLYWLAQIFGAILMGYALDFTRLRRSVRAKVSFVVLLIFTMAIWGGGYAWESKQVSRKEASTAEYQNTQLVDWTDGGEKFIGPMFLYFFYGFFDAVWQTSIYWYMGCLSNSGRKAANLAGFYKGIQSAGACAWWALDSQKMDYTEMFGITWGLLGLGLIAAFPIVWFRIRDTVEIEEDLKFSDETVADVVIGAAEPKGDAKA